MMESPATIFWCICMLYGYLFKEDITVQCIESEPLFVLYINIQVLSLYERLSVKFKLCFSINYLHCNTYKFHRKGFSLENFESSEEKELSLKLLSCI